MKVKTSELSDAALDRAVALVRDESVRVAGGRVRFALSQFTNDYDLYSPSTDWAQGGPIIEQEKIDCVADPNGKDVWRGQLYATRLSGEKVIRAYGPTPLIAAMRCIVASKLGSEVDVPEELVTTLTTEY